MKINAQDKDGNLKEYDVILNYHSESNNKDYLVYTDNKYNHNNELNVYINEYNKMNKEMVSSNINSQEFKRVKEEINTYLLAMQNEKLKLEAKS